MLPFHYNPLPSKDSWKCHQSPLNPQKWWHSLAIKFWRLPLKRKRSTHFGISSELPGGGGGCAEQWNISHFVSVMGVIVIFYFGVRWKLWLPHTNFCKERKCSIQHKQLTDFLQKYTVRPIILLSVFMKRDTESYSGCILVSGSWEGKWVKTLPDATPVSW